MDSALLNADFNSYVQDGEWPSLTLEHRGHSEYQLFFPRTTYDLYADR